MTTSSDAVIYGEVEKVYAGRTSDNKDDPIQYIALQLRVSELLAGDLVEEANSVTVEVVSSGQSPLDELQSRLPGDDGIYFLRNKGLEAERLGLPADVQEERGFYRFVSSQGVFTNVDGEVETPLYIDEGFPRNLRGEAFREIREQVRSSG
jgi:hypothetical protein